MEHTSLEGTVCTTTKERRQVPYSMMDKYSYIMTFGNQMETSGKSCASESRMQEICLSGSIGGFNIPLKGGII